MACLLGLIDYNLFNFFFFFLKSSRPSPTPQTPPVSMLQILTPPNSCLLLLLPLLLNALIRTLNLFERRTGRARPIAELLTLLTAGEHRWSLEEAGETEEKEEVDEEDMRFLHLCWRTWPSSACLQQKAAGTAERHKTPANTETDF